MVPAICSSGAVAFVESAAAEKSRKPDKLPAEVKPALTLNVRDYGAVGDGTTKDTVALQQAIDRCWVFGGGEVVVPAGNYFTGAIALRSNVLLRLEKDAVIVGSPDFDDYPVMQVRWEGKWIPGRVGLIHALQADHTGIVGPGKIMGNYALGGRPNAKNPLRHPALIEPIGCSHLRFEDFSTDYHLMWSLHPTYCEDIVIRNLTIRSTGGNGDGIDVDSCKRVLIDGCDIATGDDCISIKSGRAARPINCSRPARIFRSRTARLLIRSSRVSALGARPRAASAMCALSTASLLGRRRLRFTLRVDLDVVHLLKILLPTILMCQA